MIRIRRFTYAPLQLVAADFKSAFAGSGPIHLYCISPAMELDAAPKCPARYFSSSLNAWSNNDHDENWYDSHEVGTENTGPDIGKTNNWKSFKDVPVHPSILTHIEALGVGIRPRRDRSHKSKQKRRSQKNSRREDVLNDAAERDYFNNQRSGGGRITAKYGNEKRANSSTSSDTSAWLPPLPFAATSPSGHGKPNEAYRIERLPVKLLGSATSVDDAFPRSTKGLAEVALAGRSNVGKSTLLNALLYGNLPDDDGQPVKRRLGRRLNPQVTKMPRGKKAVVSSKPGETKAITLYQLSSEVTISAERTEDEDNARARPAKKAKMSLVLSDLPGYGFSYVSEERAKAWKELMQHYLLYRGKSLKRVLLLIDARHGMKSADFEFLDTLQEALKANVDAARLEKTAKVRDTLPPIQIVLTKCDLVKQKDLARRVVLAKQQLSDSLRREPSSLPVMLVSARPGVGYNNVHGNKARGGVLELQRELAALVPKRDAHKYVREHGRCGSSTGNDTTS